MQADSPDGVVYICAIYERRPDICRIGYARPESVSPERYYDLTVAQCNAFQLEDGMHKRFRVPKRSRTHATNLPE